jgi:alanyl-tRNA synthetase
VNPADIENIRPGMKIRGVIDTFRRRDHMQQHSGQHVLSAAFERLYQMPTVSFHMGAEACTIDLAVPAVSDEQLKRAEELSNQVIFDNRPVAIRFVGFDEAKELGLRKLPDVGRDELRLIDIADFDLCACGGTHVQSTAQIGVILVRKAEKAKQGTRVEFVAGDRALRLARRDYETLTQAASLFTSGLYEVPQNIRKQLDEAKAAQKQHHRLLEELAEMMAEKMIANSTGAKLVTQTFADRDVAFVKLLAQKLSKHAGVTALLATSQGQPTALLARAADVDLDAGAIMKEALAAVGGQGGGSKDLAQGGTPDTAKLADLMKQVTAKLE